MNHYSNGKLLITGEYAVLDGATALAVPTKFGQDLVVTNLDEPNLVWESFTHFGTCWFQAIFELENVRLVSATFSSEKEGNTDVIAETLLKILKQAQLLNPDFLASKTGFLVKTNLTFPQDWGLGSSSTLINNIASWANVNAFDLLFHSFGGSGYDIACAQNNSPITYQLVKPQPIVTIVQFEPSYLDSLFFVYLNKKQNSRDGIAHYRKNNQKISKELDMISELSSAFIHATSLKDLEKVIVEHEKVIASLIKTNPVKKTLFPDYFGEVKSLGAWGGDFVLATGNQDTPHYFQQKGFSTIMPYQDMVL